MRDDSNPWKRSFHKANLGPVQNEYLYFFVSDKLPAVYLLAQTIFTIQFYVQPNIENVMKKNQVPLKETKRIGILFGTIFYSKYLPRYSNVIELFVKLRKKNVEINWTQRQTVAFETLKKVVMKKKKKKKKKERKKTVVRIYDPKK